MIIRSRQLWMAAYFLSKFAEKTGKSISNPPAELRTTKWKDAYRMFYEALGAGRTISSFEHSLKNTRDAFDSHLDSNRVGWFDEDGKPSRLNTVAKSVLNRFSKLSRSEVWYNVSAFADANVPAHRQVFDDLSAMQEMEDKDEKYSKTEGGLRVIISVRYERNISLRNSAFQIHGYDCGVCGFNFSKTYGEWGCNFGEVHHLIPIAEMQGRKRKVNPRTDLIILCSNCHRMIHRKKNLTLTVEELKNKLVKASTDEVR